MVELKLLQHLAGRTQKLNITTFGKEGGAFKHYNVWQGAWMGHLNIITFGRVDGAFKHYYVWMGDKAFKLLYTIALHIDIDIFGIL